MKKLKHRLPDHIKPFRYKLILKPDLSSFVFDGEETIYLNIKKATKEITLHAKDLKISYVYFKNANSKIQISKQVLNSTAETITFIFKNSVPKGKGELVLKFKGILNDKMRGFYRSRYIHGGIEKHLATTQFEATDARRAFPCFDEPSKKAIFDVSVIVPGDKTVVSNSIELESEIVPEHGEGFKLVKFAPTPKMSTYLLAFIVGDLEFVESKTKRGVVVRVFTTPGKKYQAKFALECACKTLDFYEKYFGIKYPLPLLDMIAIPDFTSGAMENWGAITYRESALLVDEKHSSTANKQWVALVIAHEIAHQWFGNLVTMHWWTDLWLNEGFASYIEYMAVHKLFPEWDIWTQFMNADLGPALRLDSLSTTHPIEVQVKHPNEIGEIFDAVSYSKGASIIRMLAEYLGEKDFQKGLRHYLITHAYGNTNTSDLWKALEKISKKPVTKLMKNWTKFSGYPLVSVKQNVGGIQLSQSRFYSSRISRKQNIDKTLWQIPIRIQSSNYTKNILLNSKSLDVKLSRNGFVKLNSGETSMFRTDYPPSMLRELEPFITKKTLGVLDRLGLIRDVFALAESGQLPTTTALEFVLAYKKETDYSVWLEISSGLSKLDALFVNTKAHNYFKKFALEIYSEIIKTVGWQKNKNESHTFTMLRSLILGQAGNSGHKSTIMTAQKLFKKNKILPDLRSVVYKLVAQNGGATEFRKFIKMHEKSELHEEKTRISSAMASFKQQNILKSTLKFSKTSAVRAQDMPSIIISMWNNPYGKILVWNFVKTNIKFLMGRFALGGHMLSRILAPAGIFVSKEKAREFEEFFKKHPTPGAKRTITQVLEKIYSNEAWLKSEYESTAKWLMTRYE